MFLNSKVFFLKYFKIFKKYKKQILIFNKFFGYIYEFSLKKKDF